MAVTKVTVTMEVGVALNEVVITVDDGMIVTEVAISSDERVRDANPADTYDARCL